MTELAHRLSMPQSTVSGEVRRLADADILTVRPVGRSRLVRANEDSRLAGPLAELLVLTYGPHVVIADEFAGLEGVVQVVIFGSWAARYQGERGRPPNDVDVLVAGTPDRVAMYTAERPEPGRQSASVRAAVQPARRPAPGPAPASKECGSEPALTAAVLAAEAGLLSFAGSRCPAPGPASVARVTRMTGVTGVAVPPLITDLGIGRIRRRW